MCIVILDADNTLWNTNEIFTNAQMAILEELNKTDINISPKKEFKTLRFVDDLLIKKYGKYEYEFRALPLALYKFYKTGITEQEAVNYAFNACDIKPSLKEIKIAERCHQVFVKEMEKPPSLFENTFYTLDKLNNLNVILVLFSEGKNERILNILKKHNIKSLFDIISTEEKSVEILMKIIDQAMTINGVDSRECCIFVVGDMLKREIFMGNKINAITIYKPGEYKPSQKPQNKEEIPDYKIEKLNEIIPIITPMCYKNSNPSAREINM